MRSLLTILTILFFVNGVLAQQEYKVSLTNGKVIILDVNKVDIEGHNGTDIIIVGEPKKKKKDERADGLRSITGSGISDNTGLGLSAVKEGNEVTIEQVSKKSNKGRVTIKVPKSVSIYYEHDTHEGRDLNIKNVSSEIEVTAHFNSVKLDKVTGPMSINTVHGKVEANFSSVSQTNPVTIRSSHGLIDVTIPPSTKADVRFRASHGEMLTDFDVAVSRGKNAINGQTRKGNDYCCDDQEVKGKINGGGVLIDLKTSHGNIYFRKKK